MEGAASSLPEEEAEEEAGVAPPLPRPSYQGDFLCRPIHQKPLHIHHIQPIRRHPRRRHPSLRRHRRRHPLAVGGDSWR